MKTDNWPKDDRIDWILFRAQLENVDFGNRILKFERTNPQVYVGECTDAIFSLLKKEYDTPRKRALAATARLKQMPALLKQGLTNLQSPVKLYTQLAIQSARSIDPLFNKSLMALDVDLSPNEHEDLVKARDAALAAACTITQTIWRSVSRNGRFRADGRSKLQLLSQARFASAAQRRGSRNDRASRSSPVIGRWKRSCPIRNWPIPIQRAAQHSAGSGSLPESVRKPRSRR